VRQVQGYTLVAGPADGQRVALQEPATNWNVIKRTRPLPFFSYHDDAERNAPIEVEVIEYRPVRGVPGVLAPYGTAPELVIDMLVAKYT
jgi:hypothetical protein